MSVCGCSEVMRKCTDVYQTCMSIGGHAHTPMSMLILYISATQDSHVYMYTYIHGDALYQYGCSYVVAGICVGIMVEYMQCFWFLEP